MGVDRAPSRAVTRLTPDASIIERVRVAFAAARLTISVARRAAMKEQDPRPEAELMAERQRRFEEDLIDAYDEELEMEVDDRIIDGAEGFTPSIARRARCTSASCSGCRVNS
jgi:hypothetical protein